MPHEPLSRRTLIERLWLGTAAVLSVRRALSASPKRVDIKDPQALALGYLEDASQVDAKKFPAYLKGSNCENCLQLQGTAGEIYRPCTAFKGKLVSIKGWCSAWTAEM